MHATNVIRECGGISGAVTKNVLSSGIMHACVQHGVDIVLTGSIRDEGPIPGVTTDVVEAQKVMRDKLTDITHVLLLGTVQHSMAIATMIAPTVRTVCVDIDPWAVERVIQHQPFQSLGLVTDVEPFLRAAGRRHSLGREKTRRLTESIMRDCCYARQIIMESSTRSIPG